MNAQNRKIEKPARQTYSERSPIKEIQITGEGLFEIYLLSGEKDMTKSTEQHHKILEIPSGHVPLGLLETLSSSKTYAFTYTHIGEEEPSCISIKDAQLPFVSMQPDTALKLFNDCLGFLCSLHDALFELMEYKQDIRRLVHCISAFYQVFRKNFSVGREPKIDVLKKENSCFQSIKNLPLLEFSPGQFEDCMNSFPDEKPLDKYPLYTEEYIKTLMNIPDDVRNTFFQSDDSILTYHLIEASKTFCRLRSLLKDELVCTREWLGKIFSNNEDGLITELIRAYIEIRQSGGDTHFLPDFIRYISEQYKKRLLWYEERYAYNLGINIDTLNTLIESIGSNSRKSSHEMTCGQEDITYELLGSMNRILEFSQLDSEKTGYFRDFMESFKEYRPKIDQIAMETRRKINTLFFEIYEAVFLRYLKETERDRVLELFLVFGFMDSNLLSPQQNHDLYHLLDLYSQESQVYSIKQWLGTIMESKTPSVNSLGITYKQQLREENIGKSEQEKNINTKEHRLHYEIMNMFKPNHRICSGHSASYFPVLCNNMLPDDIHRLAVTPGKIRDVFQKILEMDCSAFHREVFYLGETALFKKELIMKQIIPDIVLMPVVGTRAFMWQELSNVSRISPGRWLVPLFTSEDLFLMVMKLTGQFRWELCRSMMGVRWNDVSYKCLTAAYTDYIENYRKNKNLSPEIKERLRTQIKRYRNNLRELFTSDYETWLRYEYQGMRRLNKEARSILYRYCPFPKSLREQLMNQPIFSDIATRFENERTKYIREMESRYAYYVKKGRPLEPELEENLKFYKET